ncbi:MAG: hypothetical protein O3B72_12005, partial [Proteobacteria bacterium]|nr:hypothetical protein [Pseudomonadota bacterium]
IVVAASVLGFIWSLAWLRRELNAPSLLDWLFLAVPFGFAYEWGFLNFLVCAPLGPLFLVHYHRFLEGRACGWSVMAWTLVLFFGHLLIVAFFCVTASAMALRNLPAFPELVRRILPMTVSIPLALGWMLLNVEPRNISNPVVWNIDVSRLTRFFPDLFSLEYSLPQTAVAMTLVALPFLLGVRPRWCIDTVAPGLFYVAFMLLAPSLVFDNLGTLERFQMFGLMFLVLLCRDARLIAPPFLERMERLVVLLPGIVGIALLGRIAIKAYGFEQESADFRRMLTYTEPHRRALSLVEQRNSAFARVPVYLHFPVWYQVEQQGLVDFNFAEWPSLNSFYRPAYRSGISSRLAWRPAEFDWEKHHADNYDYFLVEGREAFVTYIFRDDAHRVALRYQGRNWFLFERIQ